MSLYAEFTPIELYQVEGHDVCVKRDDLYAAPPAPPLAKLRGIRAILTKINRESGTLVGCFQASQSRIGQGLAAACQEFPCIKCVVAFPEIKGHSLPDSVVEAGRLGARIVPIRNNIVQICFRQTASIVESEGGWMLPFGFECLEAIQSVRDEAKRVPVELLDGGTLIVACGSGVTLAGLLLGLPRIPSRIIGVSVGRSVKKN